MNEALVGLLGTIFGAVLVLIGQWFRENRQQKSQFRLAAIDKRLAAHQQAFALWQELVSVVHHLDKRGDVVRNCQDWWYNNCLYLDPRVRDAFRACYSAVFNYDSKSEDVRNELWPRIMAPGNLIQTAVDLPPIGDIADRAEGPIQKLEKKSQGV